MQRHPFSEFVITACLGHVHRQKKIVPGTTPYHIIVYLPTRCFGHTSKANRHHSSGLCCSKQHRTRSTIVTAAIAVCCRSPPPSSMTDPPDAYDEAVAAAVQHADAQNSGTKRARTVPPSLADIYVIGRDLQHRSSHKVGSDLSENDRFRAFFGCGANIALHLWLLMNQDQVVRRILLRGSTSIR